MALPKIKLTDADFQTKRNSVSKQVIEALNICKDIILEQHKKGVSNTAIARVLNENYKEHFKEEEIYVVTEKKLKLMKPTITMKHIKKFIEQNK